MSDLPNVLKLKWKCCEKEPPKYSDYYIIKYDQKHYQWFLAYYLESEKKFMNVDHERVWKVMEPQPWRWAYLPRIKRDKTLFDIQENE